MLNIFLLLDSVEVIYIAVDVKDGDIVSVSTKVVVAVEIIIVINFGIVIDKFETRNSLTFVISYGVKVSTAFSGITCIIIVIDYLTGTIINVSTNVVLIIAVGITIVVFVFGEVFIVIFMFSLNQH